MSQRRRASPSPSAPTGPSGVSSIHGKEDRSYFHDSPAPNSSTLIRALVHRLQSPQTWRHPRRRSTFGMGDEIAMAVKIDRIQPAGVNVRMQQGKPAYSHVVTVTGPAKMIYIAGQLARDADGNIVGPGDMRAQLEQTFKNLDACLKALGRPGPMSSKLTPSSPTTRRSRNARTCACGISEWAVRPARRSRSAASLSPRRWSRSR